MHNLEELRRDFLEKLEGLKTVKTHEEREKQKTLVFEAREKLLEIDPEFRALIKRNQRNIERKVRHLQKNVISKKNEAVSTVLALTLRLSSLEGVINRMPNMISKDQTCRSPPQS